MLLRFSQLIVLDDVSSALDVETEAQLWDRIFALENHHNKMTIGAQQNVEHCTCIAVSHRKQTSPYSNYNWTPTKLRPLQGGSNYRAERRPDCRMRET